MPKCLFLFKIIDLLFRLTNDIVVDILTFGRDWPKISNPVAETKKLFACLQHVFANNQNKIVINKGECTVWCTGYKFAKQVDKTIL